MSTPQNSTSMPPEESVPGAHSNTVTASPAGEQKDISSPEHAPFQMVAVENRPESSSPAAVLPREHGADASTLADVRPRVVSATSRVSTDTYIGDGGGGGGKARESVPPRQSVGKMNVCERLAPTVEVVNDEFDKSNERAEKMARWEKVASLLDVLIGALITAVAAALGGPAINVVITTLGISSTIIAWYLSRIRESNEPQYSRLRARHLGHLRRQVGLFIHDHGHEPGDMWDDKIKGFRLTLEQILGIDPSEYPSLTADSKDSGGTCLENDANSHGTGYVSAV